MLHEVLRGIGYQKLLLGLALLVLALSLMIGSWSWPARIFLLAILGFVVFRIFRSLRSPEIPRWAWRQGTMLGGGVLLAFLLSWIFLGWTAILFFVGSVAVALLSYAFITAMRRMAIPNSVITITTEVNIRAPIFRNWGRYTLQAGIHSDVALAKGKNRHLQTKRMKVKLHREDFPEGKMVDVCNELVRDFVEKERQLLAKAHPGSQLRVDENYIEQVSRMRLPAVVTTLNERPPAEQT
ncbi:MAG: hypothetical protein WCP34_07760 [Pseudomonadota bacterium]